MPEQLSFLDLPPSPELEIFHRCHAIACGKSVPPHLLTMFRLGRDVV